MLEVEEPRVTRQAAPAGRQRPMERPALASNTYGFNAHPVAARSMMLAAAPQRQPGNSRVGAPSVVTPKRTRPVIVDRLAQQEARLFAGIVASTTIVCALLVGYLAAYAQVASLGLRTSKARVDLRNERLLGEKLQAEVARAASPARITEAAKNNGMVLEHTQQICYVNPSDAAPMSGSAGMSMRTAQSPEPTTAAPVAAAQDGNINPKWQVGTRIASRGANTDTLTTASVPN